jgi:uncharacterized protein (TIGR02246 family)
MSDTGFSDNHPVQSIIDKINAAWQHKAFDGLEDCFHKDAVIVGPGYAEFARGREKCAESYWEFATNAQVLSYSESAHVVQLRDTTAIYTFKWEMLYQRKDYQKRESGTDQLVFGLAAGRWQIVWRYVYFEESK